MREESDKIEKDREGEQYVHRMIERVFYSQNTDFYEEITEKKLQLSGIDSVFSMNGYCYNCDEKTALRWRNLQTFAFELSFINRSGIEQEGWFTRDDILTNAYLLIWLDYADYEIALIKKSAVEEYLSGFKWKKELLRIKNKHIRNNNPKWNYLGDKKKMDELGCRFTKAKKEDYIEEPINVLIPRKRLIEISDFSYRYDYLPEEREYLKQFMKKK